MAKFYYMVDNASVLWLNSTMHVVDNSTV